jgi:3-deoxy-alpha-D-manno-octulosonate 8-oxidase
VTVPEGIARGLSDADYQRMAASSLLHEKPLSNALGDAFRDILTTPKLTTLFQLM